MSIDVFIENFADSVEDVDAGDLTAETDYKSLKSWDSLAVLTFTDTVDMEYGVLLRKDDFTNCATLGDLYERVLSKSV